MEITISEDQQDVLRELMNIALGEATSNIAQLLNAFGTMHIPQISTSSTKYLRSIISQDLDPNLKYYVTKQLFSGEFGGEIIFTVDEASSKNLSNTVFQTENSSSSEIDDAVMELTNIVTSTIVSRLATELNTTVQFFAPSTSIKAPEDIVDYSDIDNYTNIVILRTCIEFQEQNISGLIFILTKNGATLRLVELIDKKLEELFS
ncbi:MAG: chemotaxis protein CheC [Sulfurimonadaceae bacterium]|jgi:chemotaxis protein CheC|nr:chemotaxis protein CheC [Sulfurimonadaceae bacterium]